MISNNVDEVEREAQDNMTTLAEIANTPSYLMKLAKSELDKYEGIEA